jgi:hypothetical protein
VIMLTSKTLILATFLMAGSEGYADITRDDLTALRGSATSEGLVESDGDSVFPPATVCWEVAEPRCTICVFDFGSTLLLALTRDPDEAPAYTGAEKESGSHA